MDAASPFDHEPALVAKLRWQTVEPLQSLHVVVANVTSVAKLACCGQGDNGHDGVHSGDQQRLEPGQLRKGIVPRAQVLIVLLAIHIIIRFRSGATVAVPRYQVAPVPRVARSMLRVRRRSLTRANASGAFLFFPEARIIIVY